MAGQGTMIGDGRASNGDKRQRAAVRGRHGTRRSAKARFRRRGWSASDERRPATHERLARNGEVRAENADPRTARRAVGPTRGEMPTRRRAKVYWRRRSALGWQRAAICARRAPDDDQRRSGPTAKAIVGRR